jgi:myosin-1
MNLLIKIILIYVIHLIKASVYLKNLHEKWLARNYVMSITPERKRLMEEKVIAEELFRNKKSSYESSIARMFEPNRLSN